MLFDWFTFFAQIINFLILVWLLKRFLYKPILRLIDERETHIAKQLKDAENLKQNADKELRIYQNKNEELDQNRKAWLEKAQEEARDKKEQMIQEAKEEADVLKKRIRSKINQDQNLFEYELMQAINKEIYDLSRKVLNDLANENLEEQIIKMFLSKLEQLPDTEQAKWADILRKSSQDVVVTSSFEIPTEWKTRIDSALSGHVNETVQVRYQIRKSLICGIELDVADYKVSWNLNNYLGSLEKSTKEVLQQKDLSDAG